ncbi:DUF421 domain-containing protein [Neobacillus cucumis]|uniref:DUF421 domain-containing protein n=1 Tax=Neobacillus cucumis TaxID=1740721 RepID=UPI0019635CEB|nr:YetF domain-containing protein [Neobacillus cucumis]MBM7652841.1 uncharacterized membrane protein YcaP (DUF421 family) [Neobacillus cucumis]
MWTIFWQSLLLASVGTLILRLGGRKSISQMTTPQLTIIISLGAILGGEVSAQGIGKTILGAATFVGFLVMTEWITLHWNRAEKVIKGEAVPVISEGKLLVDNLKKLRLSVDDLEKRLRMAGISKLEDVQVGTIEDNGEFGFTLMPHARPLTMGDLEKILKANFPQMNIPDSTNQDNIFTEVMTGSHTNKVPNQLH